MRRRFERLAAALGETEIEGADDEPPVPPLARRSPDRPRGAHDDGVPRRASPTLASLRRERLRSPWRGAWRAQPAAATARGSSRRRDRRRTSRRRVATESALDGPDARHRDQRARRARAIAVAARTAAARARGDEDGDAGRLAVRRDRAPRARRGRRPRRRGRRCSSSSRSSDAQATTRRVEPTNMRSRLSTDAEQPADDDVHEPDDDRRPDVRPEAVDREVGRDPLRQREHRHVDREVRKPERDDDQRQREDGEDRLHERVRRSRARRRRAAAIPSPRS